ncbi:MAG TPA: hypothetical protein ENG45_01475 [Candidatus Aenigmarchaeota archaeon]|nr:hypothetical protein [Candidatus Aenigmarchaeota archaeon]
MDTTISEIMKVVVLGGAGRVGKVILKHLSNSKKFSRVVCADINIKEAERYVKHLNDPKISVERVDISDKDSISDVLVDADIVINAARPYWNLDVMDVCLWTGTNYIDLAADNIVQQLERDNEWKRNGLSALVSIGEDPGLTNIFARLVADMLDDVFEIRIRDGGKIYSTGITFTFAPDVALEDLIFKSTIFENGEIKKVPSMEGEEIFNFPIIGPTKVYFADHEEPLTLPFYLKKPGIRYVDFKIAIDENDLRAIKVLKKLNLLKEEAVDFNGIKIVPMDFTLFLIKSQRIVTQNIRGHELILTDVIGEKDNKVVKYQVYSYLTHEESMRRFGFDATSYMTGTPAAVAAELFADGKVERKGVFPPEVLDPELFLKKVKEMGIDWKILKK